MRHFYLLSALACLGVSCLFFYRSFADIKDMNGAIRCCLLGILAAIFLLGVLLNFDMLSKYFRSTLSFLKKLGKKMKTGRLVT